MKYLLFLLLAGCAVAKPETPSGYKEQMVCVPQNSGDMICYVKDHNV
jgi:hypothetical protein